MFCICVNSDAQKVVFDRLFIAFVKKELTNNTEPRRGGSEFITERGLPDGIEPNQDVLQIKAKFYGLFFGVVRNGLTVAGMQGSHRKNQWH